VLLKPELLKFVVNKNVFGNIYSQIKLKKLNKMLKEIQSKFNASSDSDTITPVYWYPSRAYHARGRRQKGTKI